MVAFIIENKNNIILETSESQCNHIKRAYTLIMKNLFTYSEFLKNSKYFQFDKNIQVERQWLVNLFTHRMLRLT